MTPVKPEKKDVYSRSLQLFPLPPPFGTGVYTQKNTRLGALTPQSQAGPETGKLTQAKGHIDEQNKQNVTPAPEHPRQQFPGGTSSFKW